MEFLNKNNSNEGLWFSTQEYLPNIDGNTNTSEYVVIQIIKDSEKPYNLVAKLVNNFIAGVKYWAHQDKHLISADDEDYSAEILIDYKSVEKWQYIKN